MKSLNISNAETKREHDYSWDFKGSNTKYGTHGMHTYPAMMIPQIAKRLIDEYGNNAKSMLDPFMGTGTSLVEAKMHHGFKHAYGVDINPLARLIAKVKTTPIPIENIQSSFETLMENIDNDMVKLRFQKEKIETPDYFNIEYWFKPYIIEDLTIFKGNIWKIKDDNIRDFFKVCFSETIRNVSNTRNREFKLYKMSEKQFEKHNPDTVQAFYSRVNKNIECMKYLVDESKNANIEILDEDSRKHLSIPDNSIDIILTSPPYGDSRTTVAYGQFSRLSLQWLDFDYKNVIRNIDKISLGGVKIKSLENELNSPTLNSIINQVKEAGNGRANDVLSFYVDFNKCIHEFNRIMKTGSVLCFVVGNRTVSGINIPSDIIISELFQSNGNYEHIKTIVRNIPSKRMPKSNSPTNKVGALSTTMNHEYIVILKKM